MPSSHVPCPLYYCLSFFTFNSDWSISKLISSLPIVLLFVIFTFNSDWVLLFVIFLLQQWLFDKQINQFPAPCTIVCHFSPSINHVLFRLKISLNMSPTEKIAISLFVLKGKSTLYLSFFFLVKIDPSLACYKFYFDKHRNSHYCNNHWKLRHYSYILSSTPLSSWHGTTSNLSSIHSKKMQTRTSCPS